MKHGELLAIGAAYIDINVPNFPLGRHGLRLESEVVGGDYQLELGGSAVNFARLCSALGIPTGFVGKVGHDTMGKTFSELLAEAQIRPALVTASNVSTNIGFNMVASGGKSIMAVTGTANQSLTANEVYKKASEHLSQTSFLYIGGCFKLKTLMPAFVHLVNEAKQANVQIILDHGRVNHDATEQEKELVRQLALLADFYLPSADEFIKLWGVQSVQDGLTMLQSQKQGFTVVKNGHEGAIAIINEELVTMPAYSVTPLHTIGAGDSFNAGFIAALHNDASLYDCVRFGSATAALKISQPALPTYQEVEALVSA